MSSMFRYEQVCADLRARIGAGEWRAGDRLPSLRDLAAGLRISLSTAKRALQQLEDEGWLLVRPQSGSYVRERTEPAAHAARSSHTVHTTPAGAAAVPPLAAPAELEALRENGSRMARLMRLAEQPVQVPLQLAELAPSLLPTERLARVLTRQLKRDPQLLSTLAPPQGWLPLREVVAERLRALDIDPPTDAVLITQGATEAISLALRAVTRPGDKVLIESPVYFGLHQTIAMLGLRPVEVPCAPRTGLAPEAVEFALQQFPDLRCIVVTPNFQNPTGALMPDEAKRRLLALAARHGATLIEDDIFGDLQHAGARPRPLKAWDHEDRVIYCTSASKALSPAFRLGWVVSARHAERLHELKLTSAMHSPSLPQSVLAEFIGQGGLDEQLRRLRRALAEQMERYLHAIDRHFPRQCEVTRPAGGLLLWLALPPAVDAIELLKQAVARSVSFSPGTVFSSSGRFQHHLRLSVGQPWTPAVEAALASLGRLVSEAASAAGAAPSASTRAALPLAARKAPAPAARSAPSLPSPQSPPAAPAAKRPRAPAAPAPVPRTRRPGRTG
jgi:DNA-binding transcriptional MocR family regulator